MTAPYRDVLNRIRQSFPQPISDRVHDSYFIHSIMRALDQVDTFHVPAREFTDPAFAASLRKHDDYNRRVSEYVHAEAMAGRGVVLSLTDCYRTTTYGEPIVGLKSFILSPFVDEEHVKD